jgi:NADPH:quinone reductase-like Zn-dependent oxidoreductase
MSTVARSDNATDAGLKPLEIHMRRIVHHELGEPARVLRVEDGPSTSLGPDQVRVRLSYAPIHPGDLHGVTGSPAFGTPPTVASGGRVPGFEGAGVVSEVGPQVDPALGLKQGLRVAFFPASGAWSDEAAVPASSVVPLPDSIPDEVGAQMLINTVTALTVIRAAHDSLPPDARTAVVALLTGAGSAVGRLIGKVLTERGVKVIRLVRSEASAAKLTGILPGSPVFATEVAGWKDRVRAAAEGAKIHVAIDSVGGRLLGDVADLLAERTGTVMNFGSLGGETSDIRLFPPRSLTLKGVVLGSWMQQPPEQRKADIALAQRLAHEPGTLFEVAERYAPSRIAHAVAHVSQAGRAGVVLIDFSRN